MVADHHQNFPTMLIFFYVFLLFGFITETAENQKKKILKPTFDEIHSWTWTRLSWWVAFLLYCLTTIAENFFNVPKVFFKKGIVFFSHLLLKMPVRFLNYYGSQTSNVSIVFPVGLKLVVILMCLRGTAKLYSAHNWKEHLLENGWVYRNMV